MINKKPMKAIIYYKEYLSLTENQIRVMLDNKYVEFLISIKKDEYKKLKEEEKQKLRGFRFTEMEPLKRPKIDKEKMFVVKDFPKVVDINVVEKSFKEKHLKASRPYAPRKILKSGYNSKKRGGR